MAACGLGGLVSYSAYLWNQQLFALTRLHFLDAQGTPVPLLLVTVTLELAALMWRYVGRTLRNRDRFSRQMILLGAVLTSGMLLAFGLASRNTNGFPSHLPPEMAALDTIPLDRSRRYQDCRSNRHQLIALEDSCIYGDPRAPSIALVGDNHVKALAPAFEVVPGSRGIGLRELSYGGCPVKLGLSVIIPGFVDCDRYTELAYDWLAENPPMTTITVNLRWPLYLSGDSFDNGGVEVAAPGTESVPCIPDIQTRAERMSQVYVDGIQRLRAIDLQVILVYSAPEMGWDVPYHLVLEMRRGLARRGLLSISPERFRARNALVDAALDAIPDGPDLIRIRPADLWCDTLLPARCVAQDANLQLLYFDDNHVIHLGARLLADKNIRAMEAADWLPRHEVQ